MVVGVDGVNSRLVDFNFSGFWRGLGRKMLAICRLCAVFGMGIFLRNFLICFNRRPSDAMALMGGFPGTPAVYRVTNNRRLADAYAGARGGISLRDLEIIGYLGIADAKLSQMVLSLPS